MSFLKAIKENFLGYDLLIIIIGIGNFYVFIKTNKYINRVYKYFHVQDHTLNLPKAARKNLGRNKRKQDELSGNELMEYRSKANSTYALFTTLTTIFPLLGMLGTVISLIPMVDLIGEEMNNAFFSALTSTFWGISFAIFFKVLDSCISFKIEDNELYMDHFFNPTDSSETEESE